ncbi:hypothetical protein SASPL_108709 [Salvia splendens]|uniref:uracil phosphoribosyltransferase n=1 Tax=Salvia splendens TaxID=180675 RepID=A0A8X9A5M5_SALSN|nr:hypothetical protein SASPL_108709 [Salvia splendens]
MGFAVMNSPILLTSSHLIMATVRHSARALFNIYSTRQGLHSDCRQRRAVSMNCQATAENSVVSGYKMLVFVPPHPLIKHWISVLRNEQTPCPVFSSQLSAQRSSRQWVLQQWNLLIQGNPLQLIVPILRAGLALAEHAPSVLPAMNTYHLGIGRNEETLQPSVYLNKLPDKFPEGSRVFVVDPMLATGGTVPHPACLAYMVLAFAFPTAFTYFLSSDSCCRCSSRPSEIKREVPWASCVCWPEPTRSTLWAKRPIARCHRTLPPRRDENDANATKSVPQTPQCSPPPSYGRHRIYPRADVSSQKLWYTYEGSVQYVPSTEKIRQCLSVTLKNR